MKRVMLIAAILVMGFVLWRVGRTAAAGDRFRVAVVKFQHETCTFCPGGDTDVERWTRLGPTLKGDEVLEGGSYIRGFVARARVR